MTNVLDIYKIVRNWLLASKINFQHTNELQVSAAGPAFS